MVVLLTAGLLLGGLVVAPAGAGVARAASGPARGAWQVQALGGGQWRVRWTSPTLLPITSDRPEIVQAGTAGSSAAIGVPTIAADGKTVQAVVTATAEPDPSAFDVVLSGVRLDETAPPAPLTPKATITPRQLRSSDPGTAGKFDVVSSDYTLPSVKVSGYDEPIEMVGHVVEPAANAATGPRPLVLFLHGRHSVCYSTKGTSDDFTWPCKSPNMEIPSQLGYDYLQRTLAGQGYATVSIRVNGINAQDYAADDGGASARATIVAKHLDYWATIAGQHRVDLSKVVLIGHSRGGEGVDTASLRIPLTAPYRVVGEVLIAPTDFAGRSAPYVPTVTLLPYCDGDVSDLQGQQYTDTARDLVDGDTALKSSVLIMGANHNFFNTEWTPGIAAAPADDDWYGSPTKPCGTKTPGRLTAGQQRDVAETYVQAAVHQFTAPNASRGDLALLDGTSTVPGAKVLAAAIGGGRDIRRPSADTTLSLATGADSGFCIGQTSFDFQPGLCGSELAGTTTPNWAGPGASEPTRTFWQVGWTAPGAVAGLQLKRPLDLRDRTLDLRAIVDPRRGNPAIRVRLTDTAGRSSTVTPDGGTSVPALPTGDDNVTKYWARSIQITPPTDGSIDLAQVTRVEVLGDSSTGRLWIADLAATPSRAPAAQTERAPTLSIGQLRQKEGNTTGTVTADVPFTVSPALTRPGKFRVVTTGEKPGTVRRFSIDLAPGQTQGSIPVGYQANTLDDISPASTSITAWGQRNIVTDTSNGRLLIDDDDPTPAVTITPVHKTIKEGGTATWRITFKGPVDYDAPVQAQAVTGPGRRATGLDVPKAWLAQHGDASHPTRTLDRLHVALYEDVAAGGKTATISIPIAKDKIHEGKETVTLRITVLGTTKTSTITIASSR